MKTLPRRFKNGFQEGTTAKKNAPKVMQRLHPLVFSGGVMCNSLVPYMTAETPLNVSLQALR